MGFYLSHTHPHRVVCYPPLENYWKLYTDVASNFARCSGGLGWVLLNNLDRLHLVGFKFIKRYSKVKALEAKAICEGLSCLIFFNLWVIYCRVCTTSLPTILKTWLSTHFLSHEVETMCKKLMFLSSMFVVGIMFWLTHWRPRRWKRREGTYFEE